VVWGQEAAVGARLALGERSSSGLPCPSPCLRRRGQDVLERSSERGSYALLPLSSLKAVPQGAPWVGWSHGQPAVTMQDPHHGQSEPGGGSVELGREDMLPHGMWVCQSFCWSQGAPRLCPVASPGWRMVGPWVKPGHWYFHLPAAMGQLSINSNFAVCFLDILEIPAWKGSSAGQS